MGSWFLRTGKGERAYLFLNSSDSTVNTTEEEDKREPSYPKTNVRIVGGQ